jgi:hypothetical protein
MRSCQEGKGKAMGTTIPEDLWWPGLLFCLMGDCATKQGEAKRNQCGICVVMLA